MPLPKKRTSPVEGTGPVPNHTVADEAWGVAFILEQPSDNEIARGTAGDCCILCGKVGVPLPVKHGCHPNIDVQAYRAQLTNSGRLAERWWSS
jgi:hypothetical protein